MAIDRDLMGRKTVPGQGTGPVGMNEPTFRMEMPRLASVLDRMSPMPDRGQLPMPRPDRRFDFRRDMPNPVPMPPPGMGPFRPMPFPDMIPRRMQPAPMPNIRAPREGMGPAGMTQQEMRRETGSFDMPMPGMGLFRPDSFLDKMPRGSRQGIMESVAVDPSDYRTILKLIDAGLDPNDYVQQASMMYDDDDYGPFIPPSVLEMDRFGTDYGPQDEYFFDKERGFENRIFGIEPNYFRGGIASLLK